MAQAIRIILGLIALLFVIALGVLGYALAGPIGAVLTTGAGLVLASDAMTSTVYRPDKED